MFGEHLPSYLSREEISSTEARRESALLRTRCASLLGVCTPDLQVAGFLSRQYLGFVESEVVSSHLDRILRSKAFI